MKARAKRKRADQRKNYAFSLPDDRYKLLATALAEGHLAALRDHPESILGDDAIMAKAEKRCKGYTKYYAGKLLTNNTVQFCAIVLEGYTDAYKHIESEYHSNREV